jgi:hypothetical protein
MQKFAEAKTDRCSALLSLKSALQLVAQDCQADYIRCVHFIRVNAVQGSALTQQHACAATRTYRPQPHLFTATFHLTCISTPPSAASSPMPWCRTTPSHELSSQPLRAHSTAAVP